MKRALRAWSDYRTSPSQLLEQFQKSTPAKRTLNTLWHKHESKPAKSGSSGQGTGQPPSSLQTSSSLAPKAKEHAGSIGASDAAPPSTVPDTGAPAAGDSSCTGAAVCGSKDSPSRLQHTSDGGGIVDTDVGDRAEAGNDSSGPGPPQNFSSVQDKSKETPEKSEQGLKKGNAFSMLMGKAKQAAAAKDVPQMGAKPPASASQQNQQRSWKDALRQVALDPERWACWHCWMPAHSTGSFSCRAWGWQQVGGFLVVIGERSLQPRTHCQYGSRVPRRHRSRYPEMVLAEECLLIHDGFPKAEYHALVMPRDPSLHDLRSLSGAYMPLLKCMKVNDCWCPLWRTTAYIICAACCSSQDPRECMCPGTPGGAAALRPGTPLVVQLSSALSVQAMGERWIEQHPCSAGYQMGFHSVPSMDHLHMHVVSKVLSCIH